MNKSDDLKSFGYPSLDELRQAGCLPAREELEKRACLCIECLEEIPCNPCETGCPSGAITVGDPITNIPVLDKNKCTACGQCIAACPGLAIFIKQIKGTTATVRFPWEYIPLPKEGEEAEMVGRDGHFVCRGKVVKVILSQKFNKTAVVTAEFPAEFVDEVISISRANRGSN